jgi:hypothetical protein
MQFLLPKLLPRSDVLDRIEYALVELPLDKSWSVEVKEHKPIRSTQQNNYLNHAYRILGDAIGYERDEVSEFLCGTYWGWKDKKVPKKPSNPEGIESVPVRTTTINEDGNREVLWKLAMIDYIAFVQRFAASKGVVIPDPETV